MKRAHIKLLAVVAALYAAPPGVDRVNQPVALLLVGKNARLTQGGQKRASLSMPEGELIRWGARMHTGGERVRYLSFQDGGIYEFEHTRAPFPAPSSAVNEEPDYEIRFVTPKVETRGGQAVQRGSVPARLGDVNPARVLLDAAGDPDALAALQRIDSELRQPANRENAALRFARAVMLEKAKQFAEALDEYKTLAQRFAGAAWLRKKVPELTAASRLWQEREALEKRPPQKFAVVVGVSDYLKLSQVKYADHDAQALAEYLKGAGIVGDNLQVLTNADATKAAVSDALTKVFTTLAGPRDTVLIFFSGHGLSEVAEDTSQAFLLEHDSDPQDNGTSSFSLAKLQDLVRAGPATARVLLFADIGRLPEYQGSPNRINQATTTVLSGGRISGILAGGPKEVSAVVDDPRGGHGVFTATLLAGLRSGAPDLLAYIEEQVPKATNNQQHPLRFGELPRPLVLGAAGGPPPPRRPAYRIPPLLLASLAPGASPDRTPVLFTLGAGPNQNPDLFSPRPRPDRTPALLHASALSNRGPWPDRTPFQSPALLHASGLSNRGPWPDTTTPTPVSLPPAAALSGPRPWPDRTPALPPVLLYAAALSAPGPWQDRAPAAGPSHSTVALENEGQKVILEYLRGNEHPPSAERFVQGWEAYAEASSRNPDPLLEARRLFFAGWLLASAPDVAPAISRLEAAVRLDPTSGYAYNALGIAYLRKGSYQQAAWCFRDAMLRAPHWIYPRHNLALAYMGAGAYALAEKEYRDALRLEDDTASIHFGLGLLLQQTNRNKDAKREYERALEINPDHAEAHTALGVVLAGQGKLEDARSHYDRALELKPKLSPARHDLGLLYLRQGNEAEAIRTWERTLQDDPNFIESRLSLAAAFVRAGSFGAAIEQYQAALRVTPQYTGVRRALLETEADRYASDGNRQAAAAKYQDAIRLAVSDDDRGRLKKKLKRLGK